MINLPITCADGFNISIQESQGHYSSYNKKTNKFTSVELGFPSETDELIIKYADDPDEPTETVYPYVPVEVVSKLIKKHGGTIFGEIPAGVVCDNIKRTMKRINPSKKNGYGFKERIKNAVSIEEIDDILEKGLDPDISEWEGIQSHIGYYGNDRGMKAPYKVIFKLQALAERKKKALTKK